METNTQHEDSQHRIGRKVRRVLVLQVALISVTVAAGIYVTNTIVQDSLVNEALENEAAHFWNLYQQNPQQALPNTANMLGYLATDGQMATVPAQFHDYAPGYVGRVQFGDAEPILYVTEFDQARLYLIFASENVSDLAFSAFCRSPLLWFYLWLVVFEPTGCHIEQSRRLFSSPTIWKGSHLKKRPMRHLVRTYKSCVP